MEIIIKAEPKEIAALVVAIQERQEGEDELASAIISHLQEAVVRSGEVFQPYERDSDTLWEDNRPIPPEEVDKKDDDQHYMVRFWRDGRKTTVWNVFDNFDEAWSYASVLKENYKESGRDVCDFKILRWNPSVEDWEVEVNIE